jgi:tripartite-type tricarboxylate transporter receptor subunit TctC
MQARRTTTDRLCGGELSLIAKSESTLIALLLAGGLALPVTAIAQRYPTQPIKVVVPFPPSGGADILARALAQKLTESLKIQVIVDNRAGAGGMIGTEYVARAAPDGYSLVLTTSSSLSISPHLGTKPPYDAMRDFAPVILIGQGPNVLVIHPSLPVKSLKALIAFAKARPGELNMASNGMGSLSHLTGEYFMMQAGISMVHVPYKGGAPAVTDIVAGNVSVLFASLPTADAQIRSGKLRALAVTGARRSDAAPELPTVAEAALPGFESTQWWAVFGPAGMAPAIVTKLNAEFGTALQDPRVKKLFDSVGAEIAGGTPRDLALYLKADYERWKEVVTAASISDK